MSPSENEAWNGILRGEINYTNEALGAIQALNRCIAQAALWAEQDQEWQDAAIKQIDLCFKEIW